jgi:hypothetical protein
MLTARANGLEAFLSNLAAAVPGLKARIASEMADGLDGVAQQASALAPLGVDYGTHKAGTLKASAYIEGPLVGGSEVSAEIGFGGEAEAYALVQHERLDYAHPRGGQAKFLEQPLVAWLERFGR